MNILTRIVASISRLWQRGCLGKGIVVFVALLMLGLCGSIFGSNRRTPAAAPGVTSAPAAAAVATTAPEPTAASVAPSDAPTAEVLATLATDAPDLPSPQATIAPAPEPTDVPTLPSAPRATLAPEPTQVPAAPLGSAPKGSDCPADHPVKGNIRDRNPNKGEKIYHTPESPSYKDTKPERCFIDAAEAETAGFRAPK